jgi:hypothetical protein
MKELTDEQVKQFQDTADAEQVEESKSDRLKRESMEDKREREREFTEIVNEASKRLRVAMIPKMDIVGNTVSSTIIIQAQD